MTPETITRLLKHRDAEWWPEELCFNTRHGWLLEGKHSSVCIHEDFARIILIGAMTNDLGDYGTIKDRGEIFTIPMDKSRPEGVLLEWYILDAIEETDARYAAEAEDTK